MLSRHDLYVAEKTRNEYRQALRRSYQEPSLLERAISGVFDNLRQALSRVDFPEQSASTSLARPGSGPLQSSDRLQDSGLHS
ncbi:MAG: hypothetical protein JXN59_08285 [Anaerolineae bacterium]|nr:hypothetical protein [Anaerolineae bacterium]